ncbi:hypothetical protein OXX79_010773 [Metschnikowia pulcherrima]
MGNQAQGLREGSPRPVDVTKLEGLIKDGCTEDGILLASSKIDPLDSRNSCIVIIEGVDFSKVDHLLVADYINKFIGSADLKGVSLGNNIERKRKTKDDRKLIIEFKSSVAATLALALDGQRIPAERLDTNAEVPLHLSRPGDESSLVDGLNEIAPLRAFRYLREVGTKEPLGIAFVEFFIDPKDFPSTKSALKQTMTYLKQASELSMVTEARFSCLKITDDDVIETSIQDCPIELKTLRGLVRNDGINENSKASS